MCKIERKEVKKHNAWNRKHYGKKLAKMYIKLSKIEKKMHSQMFRNKGSGVLDKGIMEEYDKYLHKCFQTCNDKYFWRGDAYYM